MAKKKAIKKTAKKAAKKSVKKAAKTSGAKAKAGKKTAAKKTAKKKLVKKAAVKKIAKKAVKKTTPVKKKAAVKKIAAKKSSAAPKRKVAPKKTVSKKQSGAKTVVRKVSPKKAPKKNIIKTGNHSPKITHAPKVENAVMEQVEIIVATPILETIEITEVETPMEFKQHVTSLREGMVAPYFEGIDQFGNLVRSSDYIGKTIILYFYPKDFTEGCTAEACSLRDEYQYLENNNYAVIGVSADSVESHKEFSDELNLPFSIIADTDHNIINAYDVWGQKRVDGRIYDGIVRTTFVIDPDGIIQNVVTKVDSAHHAQQLLNL